MNKVNQNHAPGRLSFVGFGRRAWTEVKDAIWAIGWVIASWQDKRNGRDIGGNEWEAGR